MKYVWAIAAALATFGVFYLLRGKYLGRGFGERGSQVAPELTLTPATTSIQGGEVVSITGNNFLPSVADEYGYEVEIGSVTVPAGYRSVTELSFKAPPLALGEYPLRVVARVPALTVEEIEARELARGGPLPPDVRAAALAGETLNFGTATLSVTSVASVAGQTLISKPVTATTAATGGSIQSSTAFSFI